MLESNMVMLGALRIDIHSIYVYQLDKVNLSNETFAIEDEKKGHVQLE